MKKEIKRPQNLIIGEYYSIKQTAQMINWSYSGIVTKIKNGNIPPCCVTKSERGGKIRILVSRWLDLIGVK